MTLFRPLLQNQNRIASHGILHGALLHGHSRRAVTTPTVRLNVSTPPTPTIPCLASCFSVASFCFCRAFFPFVLTLLFFSLLCNTADGLLVVQAVYSCKPNETQSDGSTNVQGDRNSKLGVYELVCACAGAGG